MADEPQRESARYTRREAVKRAGVGAGGLLLAGAAADDALARRIKVVHEAAPEANTIKIGFISPRSGALGGFGEPDPFALSLARKAYVPGVTVKGKHYSIVILDKDSQSDPARAGQLAKGLINGDKIDFMLATSTPEVVVPVAAACEAAGVPCLSTVLPWEAWYLALGGKLGKKVRFKWVFHFSFGTAEFAKAYIAQWKLVATNKKVGVMYPNDDDGNAVRAALAPQLEAAGYKIVDPGPY